jgi:hypothetical protein
MNLITELIDMSTSEKSSTVELLRKCLVLGHKLKNQTLVSWANAELNGYEGDQEVPSYRKTSAGAKANMSGPFGSGVKNMPIAPSFLEKQHRIVATHAYLREPIANYEELMRSDQNTFRIPWPQDLVVYYQGRISTENGCELVEAWQLIGRSSIAQIFDAVKNRTLGLCLELQNELGEGSIPSNVDAVVASQIQKTVTNNIYGGVNVIASDDSSVMQPDMRSEKTINITNFSTLRAALENGGITPSETSELELAIKGDKPAKFGERTKRWIKTAGSKFAISGVKLAAPIAKDVVTGLIKEHLGIK